MSIHSKQALCALYSWVPWCESGNGPEKGWREEKGERREMQAVSSHECSREMEILLFWCVCSDRDRDRPGLVYASLVSSFLAGKAKKQVAGSRMSAPNAPYITYTGCSSSQLRAARKAKQSTGTAAWSCDGAKPDAPSRTTRADKPGHAGRGGGTGGWRGGGAEGRRG